MATEIKLTLHEKLMDIQQNLEVKKLKSNEFAGFMYRSIEDIETAVKPFLLKHSLVLTFDNKMVELASRVYVQSTAILTDGQDYIRVKACAQEAPEPKKKTDHAQLTGGVSSYADKYAAQKLFLIDDGKGDPDNNHVPDATAAGLAELSKAKTKLYNAFKGAGIEDSMDMMANVQQAIGKDVVETVEDAEKVIKHINESKNE